jgi:hypothetical protein
MEETGVPGENQLDLVQVTDKLYHIIVVTVLRLKEEKGQTIQWFKEEKDRQYNGLKKKKDRQYNGLKKKKDRQYNGLKKTKTDNTMA